MWGRLNWGKWNVYEAFIGVYMYIFIYMYMYMYKWKECVGKLSITSFFHVLQLSRHKLMEVILRYVIPHPSELSLPLDHAHSLRTCALGAWRVVLNYGMAAESLR